MRAIDTNVVVRFLIADDKAQAGKARQAIEAGDIFVSSTVLLETEWVLRGAYGVPRERIAARLRGLAGITGVTVEAPMLFALALDWMEAGMDFADAMHLTRAEGCDAFLTFDGKLAKIASGRSPIAIERL